MSLSNGSWPYLGVADAEAMRWHSIDRTLCAYEEILANSLNTVQFIFIYIHTINQDTPALPSTLIGSGAARHA